jgi:hypothetical protein
MKMPPIIVDGDLIAFSQKGFGNCVRQICGRSIPNVGPLGSWGLAGFSSVGIVSHALVYEATFDDRPRCRSSHTMVPVGGQAHDLSDLMGLGRIRHFPICSELYLHESARLFNIVEAMVGRNFDNAELVSQALQGVGRLRGNRKFLTPMGLVRHCVRSGSHFKGEWLT